MKTSSKYLLTGLLFATSTLLMTGCKNNKNNTLSSQDIREYRTERYLDRVATDANLELTKAEEEYNIAIQEQQNTDSTAAKKVINKYEPVYLEAKAKQNKAMLSLNNDNESILHEQKNVNPIVERYEQAIQELEIARGNGVQEAKNNFETARSNARKILSYRRIFNTPIEERTKEDSTILSNFYKFCRSASNKGWGDGISAKLIKYMDELDNHQ